MLTKLWLVMVGTAFVVPASAQTPAAISAVLNKYGLALDSADMAHAGANAEIWEKVVKKLRSDVMPRAGLLRPDQNHV